MALKKQLSVTVINQAGEGAKLCALLKDAGINIEAISVCEFTEGSNYCYGSHPPGGGSAVIIFAVDDAVKADMLFAGDA